MDDEFLRYGDTAVEQSCVAKHNAVLPERVRATKGTNAALLAASRPADHNATLLPAADYRDSKSLAALSLAPLVAIARAEGGIGDKERSMVLSWAADVGLSDGEPAYRLVEQWLAEKPNSELLTIWKTHYVAGLSLALTREAKRELKLEILNRAKALIEATGAFSGIGQTPSHAEQAIMEEIDSALC
jgi:hypothetical protein